MRFLNFLVASLGLVFKVLAYDISRNDNLAVYWGQDSAGNQQQLSAYCEDNTIDNIILAFLYVFFGPAPTLSQPEIDFANICNQFDDPTFSGTDLADCSFMASQIKACQAKGKIVTLSLGGATGQVGFSDSAAATSLADRIWNEFLGGSSSTRPFGTAVLDGVDLDIESGSPANYNVFVNRIRSNAAGASKRYYVTAAPQCPFPDASIGAALNEASFDAVYVQFYNNFCGLNHPSDYNFATWDEWARDGSDNPNIKVYIGAAASANAAGDGYVGPNTLAGFATDAQDSFDSFGGVMLWDASEAVANNNYHIAIKNAMVANADVKTVSLPTSTEKKGPATSTEKEAPAKSSAKKPAAPAATTADAPKATTPVLDSAPGVSRTGKKVSEAPNVNSRFFRF